MTKEQLFFARDAASILRQNGSEQHAAAVLAIVEEVVRLDSALRVAEKTAQANKLYMELSVEHTDSIMRQDLILTFECAKLREALAHIDRAFKSCEESYRGSLWTTGAGHILKPAYDAMQAALGRKATIAPPPPTIPS